MAAGDAGERTVSSLLLRGVACAEWSGVAVRHPGQTGVAAVLQSVLTCQSK